MRKLQRWETVGCHECGSDIIPWRKQDDPPREPHLCETCDVGAARFVEGVVTGEEMVISYLRKYAENCNPRTDEDVSVFDLITNSARTANFLADEYESMKKDQDG